MPNWRELKKETALICLCIIGWGISVWLLYGARTGAAMLTPWQAIHPAFVYIFFAITLLLGALIFSRLPKIWLLGLLVVHSFVMHSYLPLSHELIYGADGWRHMAVAERLLNHEPLATAVISDGAEQSWLQSLDLGRLSYSQLWWTTAWLARLFNVSLIALNAWLVPLLWSIGFPLLMYAFGRAINFSERASLVLVWFSFLPFALTANGSLTLPASFGFLPWLAATVLLLHYVKNKQRRTFAALSLLAILVSTGYVLYAILFWVQAILMLFLLVAERWPAVKWQRLFFFGLLLSGVLIAIPAAEMIAGYAHFDPSVNWLAGVKQMAGNFTGLYLAAGPRSHDIATGNVIFNQTPSYAFVANLFTWSRWWLVVFMLVFLGAIGWGIASLLRSNSVIHRSIAVCTLGFFGSYLLSRYFLRGEQVLTRRLDSVLAFFFITVAAFGCAAFLNRYGEIFKHKKIYGAGVLIIIAAAITASYTLGPDIRSVSVNEYQAMHYVWQQEKNNPAHCIIADTYPLLALEAISGKRIIGGGFPITQYFGQPELSQLLSQLPEGLDSGWIERAWSATASNHCFIVLSDPTALARDFFSGQNLSLRQFGDVFIWRYNKISPTNALVDQ